MSSQMSNNLNSSGYEDSDEIMYTSGGFTSTQTDNSSSSGERGKESKSSSALTLLKNKLHAGFGVGGGRLSRQPSLASGGSGYGQAALWLAREKYLLQQRSSNTSQNSNYSRNYGFLNGGGKRPQRRDLSEPPPPPPPRIVPPVAPIAGVGSNGKRRQPLPDIFYYGSRYTAAQMAAQRASLDGNNNHSIASPNRSNPMSLNEDIR